MRMIFLLIAIVFTSFAHAKNDYLVCLGTEEAYIHKNKIGGAYKKLNQSIINELIMFSETIAMKKKIQDRICAKNIKFPSIEVLRSIFLEKSIFYSVADKGELRQVSIDNTAIESFQEQSKFVFIRFLTDLHSEVKDPKCLIKEFPELKEFLLRTKHILVDIGIENLISEIKHKKRIFKKLRNISWKENCR